MGWLDGVRKAVNSDESQPQAQDELTLQRHDIVEITTIVDDQKSEKPRFVFLNMWEGQYAVVDKEGNPYFFPKFAVLSVKKIRKRKHEGNYEDVQELLP